MTYILNKQQKCLREKAPGTPLGINYRYREDYLNSAQEYESVLLSLKSYPILPEQWEGYEDGAEVEEGEFELMDTAKFWYAVCEHCGWRGSSEKLSGGGQIADTGDYGDCYCPQCESVDIADDGENFIGTIAIPKQKQVSQTDSVKELFVDKLLAQLKEKDKRIKELEEALQVLIADHRKLYSFADMPWEDYAGRNALKKAKQALQNK